MKYKEQHRKPNTSYPLDDPSPGITSYPSSYPTFSSAFTTSSYPSSSPSSYMSPFTLSWDKPTTTSSNHSNVSLFPPLASKPPTGAFSYTSLPHSSADLDTTAGKDSGRERFFKPPTVFTSCGSDKARSSGRDGGKGNLKNLSLQSKSIIPIISAIWTILHAWIFLRLQYRLYGIFQHYYSSSVDVMY